MIYLNTVSRLNEGIDHIEDLSANEFITTVETIAEKSITEKLDGANLWFGVDEKGLFTSREGKSPKKGRFYSVEDYPMVANYNGFRAAHAALKSVETIIAKHISQDDIIEIEILFGRQPNTITYGHENLNYIVVLREINSGAAEKINSLVSALSNTISVESKSIVSQDGEKLDTISEVYKWKFTKVKPIEIKKLNIKDVDLLISKFKKWLEEKSSSFNNFTNKEIIEISLNSVKKETRESLKAEREKLSQFALDNFKNPIKDLLLHNLVRKIKPVLQDDGAEESEKLGVEGIVLRDKITGSMTKIVDRDVFTAINTFNSSIRSGVSGLTRTLNPSASVEMRGGIYGLAKIRIANLLGIDELAMSSSTRKIIFKFKKDTVEQTAQAFADSLNISSLESYKAKIFEVLKSATVDINTVLTDFKKNSASYKLHLKTGKEISLTKETVSKTLTAIAETKEEIKNLRLAVGAAKTGGELIMALYGKIINSVVNENFNLIKSFEEAEADICSSDNIEPVQNIINGKVVVKRQRKFEKKKKFSFVKAVNEEIDKATEVTNYLNDKIEELEEVDSVAFGLELDDGQIVKVYVNSKDSENFEKILSELLGKEDDVEKAIDAASETVDIIDVEWPEGYQQNADAEQSEIEPDIEHEADAEPSEASEDEPIEMEPDIEHEPEEEPEEAEEDSEEQDTEQTEDEPEEEQEDAEEDDKPKSKSKKKQPTEESMSTYGEQFKQKLLEKKVTDATEKTDKKADEKTDAEIEQIQHQKDLNKVLAPFPTAAKKAIITLMIHLGIPAEIISSRKNDFNKSISGAADNYLIDAVFKKRIRDVLVVLNTVSEDKETTLSKNVDDFKERLQNFYQEVLFDIILEIGFPRNVIKLKQHDLFAGIKALATQMQKSNKLKIAIFYLAKSLNISTNDTVVAPVRGKLNTIPVTEGQITPQEFTENIIEILKHFGIDPNYNASILTQMKKSQISSKINQLSKNYKVSNLSKMFLGALVAAKPTEEDKQEQIK